MSKNLYLTFENDKVVVISLNMSDEHLSVYANKFGISLNDLIDYRSDAKVVYINLDSEYIIGYKDKNNKLVYNSYYYQFIIQNHKQSFLFNLKPLGTPKLPKVKKINQVVISSETQILSKDTKVVEVLDLDSLIREMELCVENEEYEKAAKLRDKINSLKK